MITLLTESNIYFNSRSFMPPSLPSMGVASLVGVLKKNNIKYNLIDFYPLYLYSVLHKHSDYSAELVFKYNNHYFLEIANTKSGIKKVLNNTYKILTIKSPELFNSSLHISKIAKIIENIFILYSKDCKNRSNPFINFICNLILSYNNKYIGISLQHINDPIYSEIIHRIEQYNHNIILGGQFSFSLTIEDVKGIFKKFKGVKYIISGYGERPLINLLKNKEDQFVITRKSRIINTNFKPYPYLSADFSDYNINKYFSPFPIIPISLSRGCYWKKCVFCRRSIHRKEFYIYSVDSLINYIDHYYRLFNVRHFIFTDESLPVDHAIKLCEQIIKNGKYSIKFASAIRSDRNISKTEFNKLYKGGFRTLFWGIESGSQKILNLMKKGTKVKTNYYNLKNSHSVGISNLCFYIYDFPLENEKDFIKTISFMKKVKNYVDYIRLNKFVLHADTEIFFQRSKYCIKDYYINKNQPDILIYNSSYKKDFYNKYEKMLNNKNYFVSNKYPLFTNISDSEELMPLYFILKCLSEQ